MAYTQKNYTYNPVLSAEENVLLDRLFKLKLSHMAEALEKQFLNPNCDLESFSDRITDIINYEWDQRQTTKFNKLLRKATLKYPEADFDDSIYEPDRQLDTHTIELLPGVPVQARPTLQMPCVLQHSISSIQSGISGPIH